VKRPRRHAPASWLASQATPWLVGLATRGRSYSQSRLLRRIRHISLPAAHSPISFLTAWAPFTSSFFVLGAFWSLAFLFYRPSPVECPPSPHTSPAAAWSSLTVL
jgi:hypothetical protein